MKLTWSEASVFAFVWACALGYIVASRILEWNFERFLPSNWYFVVKKRLAQPEAKSLRTEKVPKKISNVLEELLTLMQTGNLQKSTVRMDRTFQEKVIHEVKLLEGRGLSRQLHFTNVRLSEENAKKRDFRHWSDSGREWREVIVEAAVSDKYIHRDSGKVIHESIYPHGSILLRQSRHIRHNEVGGKDRQKEQRFYSKYSEIFCPSCGAQIQLKGDETNCPYCGGFIKSNFYDWQIEDFMIYQTPDPNMDNLKYTSVTILLSFLPTFPCVYLITNMYIAIGVAMTLTIILSLSLLWIRARKIDELENLEKEIVRYDEGWLISNINKALYKTLLTPELLSYSVDNIKLKGVENTSDKTTISVEAMLKQTVLQNNKHIVTKSEKHNWKLYRSRYPNRIKSKGQAVVMEKECPSCGANYIPDNNGCCSYCGYSLQVDNAKWKML
ncbi:MAG: zinc ribbon domain-containing protein [Eubacterium sp.]|nr:zinc ribbon domain-containing protein [Eubacterium sp.]